MNLPTLKKEAIAELWKIVPFEQAEGLEDLLVDLADKAVEFGRVSVLEDFDALVKADGFIGMTPEEWEAVRKFFRYNDKISGWKTPNSA